MPPHPVDRIVLFPYQVNRSFEASVFPESLTIRLDDAGRRPAGTRFTSGPIPSRMPAT